MTFFRLLICIMLSAVLDSCSHKGDSCAIPKPTAYPRVADYGSNYHAVDSLPVYIEVNSAAGIHRKSRYWVDVNYPAYDATIYFSITPTSPDSLSLIIENRRNRMDLNISDAPNATIAEVKSPAFSSILLYSPQTRATPLQFLSSDGLRWVVSGVVFFKSVPNDASTDSIGPMVETIKRDLTHTLSTLNLLP